MNIPGTCLSFVWGVERSKTRPLPIKERVIWVPGIHIFSAFITHSQLVLLGGDSDTPIRALDIFNLTSKKTGSLHRKVLSKICTKTRRLTTVSESCRSQSPRHSFQKTCCLTVGIMQRMGCPPPSKFGSTLVELPRLRQHC